MGDPLARAFVHPRLRHAPVAAGVAGCTRQKQNRARSLRHRHSFLTLIARLPHSGAMETNVAPSAAIAEMSFEDALRELETIVSRLESGDEPLDRSIALYERGNLLRQRCAERLDAAQARIEAIRLDGQGRPMGTTNFAAG